MYKMSSAKKKRFLLLIEEYFSVKKLLFDRKKIKSVDVSSLPPF